MRGTTEAIRKQVSQLPHGAPGRHKTMVLQAFIDDSYEQGQVLILAGYIATEERWAAFSREWEEALTIRPQWHRFKMSEIVTNGGDASRERILYHYNIIRKHVLAGVVIAAPIEPLRMVTELLNLPDWFSNPYYSAWPYLIRGVLSASDWLGINEPLDFVFDYQGEAQRIMRSQADLYRQLQDEFGRKIGSFPAFRSDEDDLPLQAADMFAWIMRKKFISLGKIMGNQHYKFPWGDKMIIPKTVCMQLTDAEYRDFAGGIVGMRFVDQSGVTRWIEVPQSAFRAQRKAV